MGYLDPRHYTARLRQSRRARYRVPRQVYERLTRRRDLGRAREISGFEDLTDYAAYYPPFSFDPMSEASTAEGVDQGFREQEKPLESQSATIAPPIGPRSDSA